MTIIPKTLVDMGIPESYIRSLPIVGRVGHCSLDNYTACMDARDQLKAAAAEKIPVIISCPTSGAGKSHLSIGYLLECFILDRASIPQSEYQIVKVNDREYSRQVELPPRREPIDPATYRYARAEDLLNEICKGFESEERFNYYHSLRALLIDEVGRTAMTAGAKVMDDAAAMIRLISSRLDWMRLTIIVTPLTKEAFKARYDWSIIRRLEDLGGKWIDLPMRRHKTTTDKEIK
jgi:DNA replication protein DnaC